MAAKLVSPAQNATVTMRGTRCIVEFETDPNLVARTPSKSGNTLLLVNVNLASVVPGARGGSRILITN